MLSSIEVVSAQNYYVPNLTLPVIDRDPTALFAVRNVEGIDPVDATINTQSYGSLDGEFYVGSHVAKRNIVLTLGLNTTAGAQTAQAARAALWAYFMPKMSLTLKFNMDDGSSRVIPGYVESSDGNRFSSDPEYQVSIICPKPNFLGLETKEITGVASQDPGVTEHIYNGNLITGVEFEMVADNSNYLGGVIFESYVFDELIRREFVIEVVSLEVGRRLVLNSNVGKKNVETKKPNADTFNMLGRKSEGSLWPYLVPGFNSIKVKLPGESGQGTGVELDWTMRYVEQYGGI